MSAVFCGELLIGLRCQVLFNTVKVWDCIWIILHVKSELFFQMFFQMPLHTKGYLFHSNVPLKTVLLYSSCIKLVYKLLAFIHLNFYMLIRSVTLFKTHRYFSLLFGVCHLISVCHPILLSYAYYL